MWNKRLFVVLLSALFLSVLGLGVEEGKSYYALNRQNGLSSNCVLQMLQLRDGRMAEDAEAYKPLYRYMFDYSSHISQVADFRKLRQAHPNKMTAMPECNSVPSWENMQRDQALWLMVAPWCGGAAFDHGNTAEFWRQFLADEHVITRE